MLGAIIGDMVGSKYEFHPIKRKDFDIYDPRMRMTDDSLLTIHQKGLKASAVQSQ